ncbi:signal peptidase I [Moraxella canis]|uniref:Signal peptidase I n=1 Tax=Moraxella canis TaxID=90239 RepID=A0A1S9ZGA5_9GAMM|nr:signal peptidase I [Moraxella canis]OOR82420.1 signal peptidase I [Moraxella canis]
MNFDINLIIVPITLAFLVIWLVDKLALKQHLAVKQHAKAVKFAETQFSMHQQRLESALASHGMRADAQSYTPDAHAPSDVQAAYQDFQASRVKLATLQGNPASETKVVRWAYEFLPVLLAIVIVRAFIVEPFNIPSSSMVPTLYTGDFIAVNKSAYGLRLPITHTKILDTGSPERGDVAVFRYPVNDNIYFIKRVIGLPGDVVSFDRGMLSINGEKVGSAAANYQMPSALLDKMMPNMIHGQLLSDADRANWGRQEEHLARYQTENLGGHTYTVRYLADMNSSAQAPFLMAHSKELAASGGERWSIEVPKGQYFVMGDNRDRSDDGRFWGFVPESNLSGKATYIWMHKEPGFKLPSFERNGAID